MRSESAVRAAEVSNLVDTAMAQLSALRLTLDKAKRLSEDDYDGNAARLTDIKGGLNVLAFSLADEVQTWRTYAEYRLENN